MTITATQNIPICFSAGKYTPQEIKRQVILNIIRDVALSILTCGLYVIGLVLKVYLTNRVFMPATFYKKKLKELTQDEIDIKNTYVKVEVKTFDGVKLDAREFRQFPHSNKWLVYFGGNNYLYEKNFYKTTKLAYDLGVNLLVFNFRDVGDSKGILTEASQLKVDGSAIVDYLKHHHAAHEKDILLYGHSQGGGVVAQLKSIYKGVKIVCDRSYRSVTAVAKHRLPKSLKAFSSCLVKCFRYEIDAHKDWKKAPEKDKLVVFHRNDLGMDYKKVSLYYADKEHKKKNPLYREVKENGFGLKEEYKPNRVRLRAEKLNDCLEEDAHLYDISLEFTDYDELIAKAKLILNS